MGHARITKQLGAALQLYAAHLPECASWGPSHGSLPGAPERCDCGLKDVLRVAKAVPAPAQPKRARKT